MKLWRALLPAAPLGWAAVAAAQGRGLSASLCGGAALAAAAAARKRAPAAAAAALVVGAALRGGDGEVAVAGDDLWLWAALLLVVRPPLARPWLWLAASAALAAALLATRADEPALWMWDGMVAFALALAPRGPTETFAVAPTAFVAGVDDASVARLARLGRRVHVARWGARVVALRETPPALPPAALPASHPRVVQYLGATRGGHLLSALAPRGPLAALLWAAEAQVPEPLRLVLEAAQGVAHLHAHGATHGALSSRRLLLTEAWGCVVGDYALGLPARPQWTPPEAFAAEAQSPAAADVYALGVVLFEARFRCAPFAGLDPASLRFVVAQGKRPLDYAPNAAPSDPAVALMRAAWADDPAARGSAAALAAALEALLAQTPRSARSSHEASPRWPLDRWQAMPPRPPPTSASSEEVEVETPGVKALARGDGRALGSGSFSTVVAGEWCGLPVAVKRFRRDVRGEDPGAVFARELALHRQLRHPNVVALLAADADARVLVTELARGGSLHAELQAGPRPPLERRLERARDVARDLAAALAYLHGCSPPVLFLDLKSPNVVVHRGRHLLCDFGNAQLATRLPPKPRYGSPLWAAPEALHGAAFTPAADVFSLAIVLWEVLAWAEPHADMNPHAVMFGVASEGLRPPIDDRWPPFWRDLLARCWAQAHEERPGAAEVLSLVS